MMFILLTDVAMSTTVAKDSTTTQSPTESGMHAITTHAVNLYRVQRYRYTFGSIHACIH